MPRPKNPNRTFSKENNLITYIGSPCKTHPDNTERYTNSTGCIICMSEKNHVYHKEYRLTTKGKEAKERASKKYYSSDHGKQKLREYQKSHPPTKEQMRENNRKYYQKIKEKKLQEKDDVKEISSSNIDWGI